MNAERISNKEIARLTGLSAVHIGRVFRGEREPSWMTACVMAEALHITLDEFRRLLPKGDTL